MIQFLCLLLINQSLPFSSFSPEHRHWLGFSSYCLNYFHHQGEGCLWKRLHRTQVLTSSPQGDCSLGCPGRMLNDRKSLSVEDRDICSNNEKSVSPLTCPKINIKCYREIWRDCTVIKSCLLLLQRTGIWFPAPTSSDSQLQETLAPGDPAPSSWIHKPTLTYT